MAGAYGTPRERAAWCFFDFANSAFPTVALTAFGGPFFVKVLAKEGVTLGPVSLGPASAWGLCLSISMLLVTLSSPFMGAVADRGGRKRRLLAAYVVLCVAATAALGFVPPGAGLPAFLLYIVANFAFEGAYVFYNAFLPELAPPERVGRLSGAGWALGYFGGLLALVLCLPLRTEDYAVETAHLASRIYFVVAAWYLVFALPALLLLRDRPPRAALADAGRGPVAAALRELLHAVRTVRAFPVVAVFLVAYFLYNDGITTVIQFTGVYTSEVLAFTPGDNVVLFLVLNLIAAPGALLFGNLVDRFGGRRAILASLLVWVLVVVLAMLARDKMSFWPVAGLAAVVIGATQASSRAFMARLAPRERVGEFMGFLALSGKASAVFGPALYGLVADLAAGPEAPGRGHRVAIGAVGMVFVVAFFVLWRVDERRGIAQAEGQA